jgi:hypothetical protein
MNSSKIGTVGTELPNPTVGLGNGQQYSPPNYAATPYNGYYGMGDQMAQSYNRFYGPGNPTVPTSDIARWNQTPYSQQRGMGPSPWPQLFNGPGNPPGGGMGNPNQPAPPVGGNPQQPPQGPPPGTPPPHGDNFPPTPPNQFPSNPTPTNQFPSAPPGPPPSNQPVPVGSPFSGQYNAIQDKFGGAAANTYAANNWGSGGREAMNAAAGGDPATMNALTNASTAGGNQMGVVGGTTINGPDGNRYYAASNAAGLLHGKTPLVNGLNRRQQNYQTMQTQPWLNQNAVKL